MAETAYIGSIEVWPNNDHRAKHPADQRKLDAYWRKRDPKKKKGRSAVDKAAVHAAKAAIPGGALIPDAVYDKALAKGKKKAKWMLIKIVAIMLAVVILVVIVYLNNVYVDPDYLNVSLSMNRSYSMETTLNLIQQEKLYIEVDNKLTDQYNEQFASTAASALQLPYKGLSKERFSTANGHIEGYTDINEELYKYVTECGTISVGGVNFDGLLYMAMCNDESASWLCDTKRTISSAFPSKLLDINKDNYVGMIHNMDIAMVFSSEYAHMLNENAGKFQYGSAWMWEKYSGYGRIYAEQGPATQRFVSDFSSALAGRANEYGKINNADIKTKFTQYNHLELYDLMLNTCTGSGYSSGAFGTILDNGDRWCIADTVAAFNHAQNKYLNMFVDKYKYGGTPSEYELVAAIQMIHWMPATITDVDTANSYVLGKYPVQNAYLAQIHGLASEQCISIIQEHVKTAMDKGLYNWGDYKTCGPTMIDELSDTLDSMNIPIIVGTETTGTYNTATCTKGTQGQEEVAGFLFNYIMLKTLYSEGNGGTS